MRVSQYISSFILFHALGTYADEDTGVDSITDWIMRINFPVGSDYFIKYTNEEKLIQNGKENPDSLEVFGNTDKKIIMDDPPDTMYHVVAQMDWAKRAPGVAEIDERQFWVGKGSNHSVPVEEMQKYVIQLRRWPKKDIHLWLGPDYSYVKGMDDCGTINSDWLAHPTGEDDTDDWNDAYFKKPVREPADDDCE